MRKQSGGPARSAAPIAPGEPYSAMSVQMRETIDVEWPLQRRADERVDERPLFRHGRCAGRGVPRHLPRFGQQRRLVDPGAAAVADHDLAADDYGIYPAAGFVHDEMVQ